MTSRKTGGTGGTPWRNESCEFGWAWRPTLLRGVHDRGGSLTLLIARRLFLSDVNWTFKHG